MKFDSVKETWVIQPKIFKSKNVRFGNTTTNVEDKRYVIKSRRKRKGPTGGGEDPVQFDL
jgi:hypothetical protein